MELKLVRLVVIAVTVMWAVSLIADIILPSYDPSPYVSLAMMGVVGGAMARYLAVRNGVK